MKLKPASQEDVRGLAQEQQSHGKRIGEIEDRLSAIEKALASALGIKP